MKGTDLDDLYQRLAGLSPERQRLIELRMKNRGLSLGQRQRIPRSVAAGPYPLSYAQERLWFLNQFEPQSPAYNISRAYRLCGSLDVMALERSLNEIVGRHATLRTTFTPVNGQPFQVIAPSLILAMPVVDLRNLPEADREARAQRSVRSEALRPFDLARGPLLRAGLIRLRETEHILLLSMHHIVCDEWSSGLLFSELAALYGAFAAGASSPLAELPIQYPDYAVWQREWLQGPVLESELSYWEEKLAGAPPSPVLPTDYPRPPRQTYRGAREDLLLLPPSRLRALRSLSQQEDATLFMTLLAAFKVLLYRHTGQEDVVVGTPIANRSQTEVEPLIGLFLNTLALRTDLSGSLSFRECLARVRQVALEAYSHQELPFERLVAELQPGRNLSHSPLFQIMFVLQGAQSRNLELPALATTPFEIDTGTAKFDLTLFARETSAGLRGTLEYNTDLFQAGTMARLLGHLQTLLEGITDVPDQEISRLPLLTSSERNQLLEAWNRTRAEYSEGSCVHHLFEMQAERTPDAPAAVFQGQALTYRDLDGQANRLAHYLQEHDVGPEVRVGICTERSLEMVVGVLGILKAGGAYLPLDLSHPIERQAFMLKDAGVQVLVTQQHLLPTLPEHQVKVICLDADWEAIAAESSEKPISEVRADHLAYVLYTSGSTGQPKGVAMSHRPLYNLIQWQLKNSRLPDGARMLQFSPLSFDASFVDLFWSWASGGSAVLISDELRRDAVALLAYLADKSVERVNLPVIALQKLAEAAATSRNTPGSLAEIVTTAEPLKITQEIADLVDRLPHSALHNQYGPTETHVVTSCSLEGSTNNRPALPPIGRPISNTQIYLLDGNLEPVPIGVAGELYVGGDCLSRGYLNRPRLTAERFIPDPFGGEPGARLYRTGDLARYLPDGNIEFLGRSDHQLKIRGFRIEPGEIEAVLAQQPTIANAVVQAMEDAHGGKQLVAYVVPGQEATLTITGLRDSLRSKLPEYMVPSAFVVLDALPLTPSGKVNRRALPAPDQSRPELAQTFVPPRTPVEEMLAAVWAQVLAVDRVGAYDDFFDLGGHSLVATRVISRLRDLLQVELPLRIIFEAPTVAELSEAIIAQETIPGRTERTAQLLKEIKRMPADELGRMLEEHRQKKDTA